MPVKKSLIAGEVDCDTIDEEVTPLGLSLEGIKQLLLDVYPQIKDEDLTTGDMNEAIIKPATKGTKKSFTRNQVGIRGKSGRYVVQPATVFISHAWKYHFFKVNIDVFEQYEKANPNTYFWFCLFNNDQHEAGNNDYEFFAKVFRRSLTSIGKMLVMMSPWNDPKNLERVWCLYEIFLALLLGIDMEVMLPEQEVVALEAAVRKENKCVLNALTKIDVEKANSFYPADRENILAAVRKSVGGAAAVNKSVADFLRKWYLSALKAIVQKAAKNDFLIYGQVAKVFTAFGLIEEAIEYHLKALKIKTETLGENDRETADSYNGLGAAYRKKGDFDRAIEYYERSVKITVATLGENHPHTAASYNGLGSAYRSKGDVDRSIEYFERSLKIYVATVGENHPSTATSYNNLGSAYKSKGDVDRAIEYYEKALHIFMATVGLKHPHTEMVQRSLDKAKPKKQS